jgi:hypothetical protein
MEELAQWEDAFAADTTTSPTDAHNGAVDDGAASAGLDEMFTTEQGVREAKVLTKHVRNSSCCCCFCCLLLCFHHLIFWRHF